MKPLVINLNEDNRKYIEIELEVGGTNYKLQYFEKNGEQIKRMRTLVKAPGARLLEVDEMSETVFFENLKGDEAVKSVLIDFYDKNGNINDFINELDTALGKLKKKA